MERLNELDERERERERERETCVCLSVCHIVSVAYVCLWNCVTVTYLYKYILIRNINVPPVLDRMG